MCCIGLSNLCAFFAESSDFLVFRNKREDAAMILQRHTHGQRPMKKARLHTGALLKGSKGPLMRAPTFNTGYWAGFASEVILV